jgi:hypothetical protein
MAYGNKKSGMSRGQKAQGARIAAQAASKNKGMPLRNTALKPKGMPLRNTALRPKGMPLRAVSADETRRGMAATRKKAQARRKAK